MSISYLARRPVLRELAIAVPATAKKLENQLYLCNPRLKNAKQSQF